MSQEAAFASAPGRAAAARARRIFSSECRFLLSAPAMASLPLPDRPEVCFTGRSNVGKSTIINSLASRRKLARTSNTPGRTREINIFAVADSHYLADLPGYGFARMPKRLAARAAELIEAYITGRPTLRRVFILIDGRRGPMELDELFMNRLDEAGVGFQIVVTKLDKVRGKDLAEAKRAVRSVLESHPAAFPEAIGTSAVTGEGIDTLRCRIAAIC